MSAPAHHITTVEELLAASTDLGRCELVRGELIMMTPGKGRLATAGIKIAAGSSRLAMTPPPRRPGSWPPSRGDRF